MRTLPTLLLATVFASPAMALQTPVPSKEDPRICTAKYDPNDVVDILGSVGDTVTIEFPAAESVDRVDAADSAPSHLGRDKTGNTVWLKPKIAFPTPEPVTIRNTLATGTGRNYVLQLHTKPQPPTANPGAKVADANGSFVPAAAIPTVSPVSCYLIRFTDPIAEKAVAVAAWRARENVKLQRQAEWQLRMAKAVLTDKRFVGQGDTSLAPSSIWSDGMTTFLRWNGNARVPALYTQNPDGKEAVISNPPTEHDAIGTLIKVSPPPRRLTIRDGDAVMAIWDQGWNRTGNNPGTGTVAPNVVREVKPIGKPMS